MILSRMLKADVAVGTAMYEALNGGEARRQALIAASTHALPAWGQLLLKAVLAATRGSRNQRNDFAHHVWAVSDDLPDAILLMHSGVVTRRNISFRQTHSGEGPNIIRPEPLDYSKIMVYRANDFKKAVDEAADAELQYTYFYDAISELPSLGYGAGRRLLLKKPSIQRAIEKLATESGQPIPDELLPQANRDPLMTTA